MLENKSNFLSSIPVVTKNLIIITFIVFIADSLLSTNGIMTKYLALHYVKSEDFMPHQIITYMFMHGSFGHFFFNMFAIFMFGRTLETVWGPKRFLSYYLLTGIGAGVLQILISYFRIQYLSEGLSADQLANVYENGARLLSMHQVFTDESMKAIQLLVNVPMIGASGAVFGVLIAFGVLFPNSELFIIPFPFPIKAKYFVIGYGVIELYLAIADRPGDNVAHFAHLGGLITGLIITLYWKNKAKKDGRNY